MTEGYEGQGSNELTKAETAEESLSEQNVSQNQKVGQSDFQLLKLLGEGGYGKVFQVKKRGGKDGGKVYAMKVLEKAPILGSQMSTAHTKSERNILEAVKHPFIVELKYAFQTKRKLYLVMEFLNGGELCTRLDAEGSFLEGTARFYLSEIVLALEHLHKEGIIYRDLKTENILLDSLGHIKLIDFGVSKDNFEEGAITTTFCGTLDYTAPEILKETGYGKAVDWWSLGAVAFDMLNGEPPFTGPTEKEITEKILCGKLDFPNHFTNDAKDLIRKLLEPQPNLRLGYGAQDAVPIRNHAFFRTCNWDDVQDRLVEPPWRPCLASEDDVSLFDSQFTNKSPRDSFDDDLELSGNANIVFQDFDYVAPSVQ